MIELIQPYIGEFITALVAGFGGWFFQRKQKHAELEALRADNSKQVVQLYQDALDDLKVRYEERFQAEQKDYGAKTANLVKNFEERHQALEGRFDRLRKEYDEQKKKSAELEKRFSALQKDHDQLKRKYNSMKKEYEEYRKKNG
jgi:hypothetical protein